jgi:tetratricopeptide (TPR) repeat protein
MERVSAGHGQIAALVGEPGVGKSRLVWEFTHSHRAQGWLVLESGSVSYGKASAYRPVIDLLKAYFQVEDRDDARRVHEKVTGKLLTLDRALESALPPLLSLLDVPVDDPHWQRLEPMQKRVRILDACRHLLMRESRVQPLLLVFEDLHWIDNETQVFLDGLVDSLPAARVLLLVNYRPEYHNRWTPKTYYTQVRVDPLEREGAQELLDALLGADPRLASLRQTLIDRTDGNPFFLEESVRSLVETGALAGTRGAYMLTATSAAVDVPATVQAILAARIDRLAPEDKRLLQGASVIGKDVPFVLLLAIADMPEPALREGLGRLQASEFLYEASLFPDIEYTFKHALTHDVAYGSLLLERRRALHAQILECIERLYADRLTEQIERLAHHAMRGEVWSRAVDYSRQAGEKAFGRSANRAAAAHFEESLLAATHLPSTRGVVEQTVDLHHSLRFCLVPLGDFTRMLEHSRRAGELSRMIDDPLRLAWSCAAASIPCTWLGRFDESLALADQAMTLSRSLNNPLLRIAIHFYPGWAHSFMGNLPAALDSLSQCADATLAGLHTTPSWQRTGLMLANGLTAEYLYVFSQSYAAWCLAEMGRFDEGIARGTRALEMAQVFDRTFLRATALVHLGAAHVIRGDAAQALALLESGLHLCRTAELPMASVFAAVRLGQAYKLTGRFQDAVAILEEGRDLVASTNAEMIRPLLQAHLADAYSLTGRGEDALTLAQQAQEMACTGKMCGHAAWALYLLAQIHAREAAAGREEVSRRYAEAIQASARLGMHPLLARCRLGLGEQCSRDGRAELAREHLTAAHTAFREMRMQSWLEKAESALRSSLAQ